jgi:hypothetical protein
MGKMPTFYKNSAGGARPGLEPAVTIYAFFPKNPRYDGLHAT